MKAITKYKLNLKLLNSFNMDLIVKKHHATYYFTSQQPKLSNWTQNKNKQRLYHHITAPRNLEELKSSKIGAWE